MKVFTAAGALAILIGATHPSAAFAQDATSEIAAILVARATTLPEGPHPKSNDDNCSSDLATPQTDAGRYVLDRGWGVISEVAIGDYQLVSFAGEFLPGTSGTCAFRQNNIGVFDGARLRAILYTASKDDEVIGHLVPLENGNVRLWSGEYLGLPVADLHVGSIGLVVGEVAAEDAFCNGAVKVPNVYDASIVTARDEIIAAGWEPVPQPTEEFFGQPELHKIGITEAISCSGTGFGYCTYAYKQSAATLELLTYGDLFETNVPHVASYAVTCSP